MTIVEAIQTVLKEAQRPLSVEDTFKSIVNRGLYAFRASDPKSVVRAQLRRHCINLDFPTARPVKYFRLLDGDLYTLESEQGTRLDSQIPESEKGDQLPEELIEKAHRDHLLALRQELMEKILANHPAFFERLVMDLLLRMGYGGGDPSLGRHTGGPGDGGIDAIIKEDKLGLSRIYVQAKRYSPDQKVSRTDVQNFAGAMVRVQKGVFITTARFTDGAREFVDTHEKTISLIDGDELCELMIRHGVGISEVKAYKTLRVDNDYFSPEG
jgi:restriction system protein